MQVLCCLRHGPDPSNATMQDALRIADKAPSSADASRQAMSTSPQTDSALLPNAAPQEKKRVTRKGTLGRGRRRQGGTPVKPSSFVSHSNSSSSSSSTCLPVTPSQPLSSFTSCVQRCLQPQNQAPMSYMHYQNTQRLPVQPTTQRGDQHMQRLNGPHQRMQSNPVPFMHRSTGVTPYAGIPLSMMQQHRRKTAAIPPALLPLAFVEPQLGLMQHMGMRPSAMKQWQQPGRGYQMQSSTVSAGGMQGGHMQPCHMQRGHMQHVCM